MSNLGDLMRTFADETNANLEAVIMQQGIKMVDSIITKSPVDTGRFRGGWICTSSRPSQIRGESIKKRRPETIKSEAITKLSDAIDGQTTFYIVNNLPYASVLEYGLYPKNVKRGTWNRDKKKYEIRSINGYSREAPAGMVRITKKEFKRDFIKAIKAMRSKK